MRERLSAKADLFWPLAVLALVAMALLVVTALVMVRQFDITTLRQEREVVQNGLAGRAAEVAHMAVPAAVWDDAVRNLDDHFDPTWAAQFIGTDLHQTDGLATSLVLDRDDRSVFASQMGNPVDPARYAHLMSQARPLLSAVRKAEARRGPIRALERKGQILADPIQASAITRDRGDLYLLTATLVQPDFGAVMPKGPRAPIVVTGMIIDKPFLNAFAQRFLLRGITLRQGAAAPDKKAQAVLKDGKGSVVATIEWTPHRPGAGLLTRLVTPMLVVTGALGLATLTLYRRSRAMTQSMIASEARAAHLAYFDALTGLPNRVLFFDRLGQTLQQLRRKSQQAAVHCIDLDRFKEVNDTFGHHIGDQLIQEAARRLAAQRRSSDTSARLSGDEFAIVQNDATALSAAALADRLIKSMNEPVTLGSIRLFVSCSVGVSIISDGTVEPAEALRHADLALYRGKDGAKGQFCLFETEMDAAIKTRRAIEVDLREALINGKLQMVYQPQVNSRGMVTAVEALVRWRHPERGDVSPAFFVPIAEQCGLIIDLGMFTLRRAFEDSKRWKKLKIAVNVSANQLRMKDFVAKISELIAELDVDPRRFELEITEGVLLGDDPDTQETLRRLRQLGFGIALDDFGTGYSSLSYLKRYPIDKIKIDRSFITNLGLDGDAEAVVSAIVSLAHALNLSVIAEGVETAQQLKCLAAAGCTDVQGFLFSRPVSADEIDRISTQRGPLVRQSSVPGAAGRRRSSPRALTLAE